jgi:GntR family transcriptional regulator
MNIIRHTSIANQVDEIIRQRIRDGDYPPGLRLPSESDLSREFGVSRATIRTVLARMNAEGLILRKQGDGTYINKHIQDVNTHLGGLWEFSRLIESSNFQPTIRSIQTQTRQANPQEAEQLKLAPGASVIWMQRLFFADEKPVILATNAVPEKIIDPAAGPLLVNLPIQKFLQRYCNKQIAYVILDLSANHVSQEAANFLETPQEKPLLNINTIFYDRDNQPIICGQSYLNDAILSLRLVQTWSK